MKPSEGMTNTEKQEKVLEWLESKAGERLRTDHKTGTGFSVFEKSYIHKNGIRKTAVEWLRDLGFEHGLVIGSYRVVHQKGGSYPESFTFFHMDKPVDVPEF